MENQTGSQERGPDDQTHRTDQPTTDRREHQTVHSPTTTQDDRSEQTESDRRYVCLECQSVVTEFPTECPYCGATAFRTATESRSPLTLREQLLQQVARTTAPLNPYIPR